VFGQYQAPDFQEAAANFEQARTFQAQAQAQTLQPEQQELYHQNDGAGPQGDLIGW